MHVGAETSELHLLTLARLDRQRVRVDPFVRRNVRRLGRVREDVENRGFINDG